MIFPAGFARRKRSHFGQLPEVFRVILDCSFIRCRHQSSDIGKVGGKVGGLHRRVSWRCFTYSWNISREVGICSRLSLSSRDLEDSSERSAGWRRSARRS